MRDVPAKVAEAADTLNLRGPTRRRLLAGTGLVSASLAATGLLAACGDDGEAAPAPSSGRCSAR